MREAPARRWPGRLPDNSAARGPRRPGARTTHAHAAGARCGAGGDEGRGDSAYGVRHRHPQRGHLDCGRAGWRQAPVPGAIHVRRSSPAPGGRPIWTGSPGPPGVQRRRAHPVVRALQARFQRVARGTTALAQRGVSWRMRRIRRRSLLGGSGSGTRSESSGSAGSSWYSSERVRSGAATGGPSAGPRNTPAFRSALLRSGLLIAPLPHVACVRPRHRPDLPSGSLPARNSSRAAETTLHACALLHERRTAPGRPVRVPASGESGAPGAEPRGRGGLGTASEPGFREAE